MSAPIPALIIAIAFAPAAFAGTVSKVSWNPGSIQSGDADPFVGQTTDASLALPGNLTANNLSRSGNHGHIGFGDCPASFDADYYIAFSVIPGPNQQLKLPDLIAELSTYTSAVISPDHVILRTSLDNYTTDITAVTGPNNLKGNFGGPIVFQLDSLPASSQPIGLRLYPFNLPQNELRIYGSLNTSGYGMWFSNIATTPTPEPASLALLTVGATALLRRRRRS